MVDLDAEEYESSPTKLLVSYDKEHNICGNILLGQAITTKQFERVLQLGLETSSSSMAGSLEGQSFLQKLFNNIENGLKTNTITEIYPNA